MSTPLPHGSGNICAALPFSAKENGLAAKLFFTGRKMLAILPDIVYTIRAVIGGELAVPCICNPL